MQTDCNVHILTWSGGIAHHWGSGDFLWYDMGNSPEKPFATQSLEWAEHLSQSDPYIICNDDNLILTPDFVQNGLEIMRKYPEFGCISGVVVNGEGSEFELNGPELKEIHAVGGCVFLRKGLVTQFPALEDPYWDIERYNQVTAKGFRSGYTRLCPYLHMGAKFSIASPAWFTGA